MLIVNPRPAPVPVSSSRSGPGIERITMNREEADVAGIVKDLLRAVAVVDIEIDDQDPVEVEVGDRFGGGQGDVGVDAEPHPRGRPGMVTRRPDQTEGSPVCSAQDERDGLDAGTRRQSSRQV